MKNIGVSNFPSNSKIGEKTKEGDNQLDNT